MLGSRLGQVFAVLTCIGLWACGGGNGGPERSPSASASPSVSPSTNPDPTSTPLATPTSSASPAPTASPATSTEPTSTPGPAPLAGEVNAGCSENIEARLTAGEGYCYEAQFASFDDTLIDLTVFVPQPEKRRALSFAPDNEAPHTPLVIHSHGFGGVKASDMAPPGESIDRQIALDLWQAGYWVISYTQRGFGNSGNSIGMMAPDKEGWDFVRLIDWAICHLRENAPLQTASSEQNTDPEFGNCGEDWGVSLLSDDTGQRLTDFDDDPAVGTIGYSYGGAFQFNAQSVDARLDALLPLGTWNDLRFSLHPNDTPKTAWITIMTAFAGPPPAGGGNGEPLPMLIVEGNTQAEGANADPDDAPNNKPRQVSTANMNTLGANGPVAYCDGHAQAYADKFNDDDGEPVALDSENRPAHASATRLARADVFQIQGYGDTLFDFNEAYDNLRCFEQAGLDAYFLAQTSGHPLPAIGPAHYAGIDTSMYLDEIVHCGVDESGEPQRFNTRDLGRLWFDDKLRGVGSMAANLPGKACITQQNAVAGLTLDTNDPYFANGTSNASDTAFMWSREGALFSNINDVPVGGLSFDLPSTDLTTGPGGLGQGLEQDPRVQFVPLTTVETASVVAGIPTADLMITRQNPAADEIFYLGIAVQRCHTQASADQDAGNCDAGLSPQLLHFQAMPIRVFPLTSQDATAAYPSDDPRNFGDEAKGHYYAIRFGDNPNDTSKGRLHGISARLYPGDKIGAYLMPEHPVYTSLASSVAGQVSISGTIQLPILSSPNPVPAQIPAYILQSATN